MIDTTATTIESPPERQAAQSKNGWPSLWRRLGLAGVILVSIFMNFYQLGQNDFGNLYYASAIRSMLDSWHYPLKYSYSPVQLLGIYIAREVALPDVRLHDPSHGVETALLDAEVDLEVGLDLLGQSLATIAPDIHAQVLPGHLSFSLLPHS